MGSGIKDKVKVKSEKEKVKAIFKEKNR